MLIIHYLGDVPPLISLFYFYFLSLLSLRDLTDSLSTAQLHNFPFPPLLPPTLPPPLALAVLHKLRWVFLHSLPPLPSLFTLRPQ